MNNPRDKFESGVRIVIESFDTEIVVIPQCTHHACINPKCSHNHGFILDVGQQD